MGVVSGRAKSGVAELRDRQGTAEQMEARCSELQRSNEQLRKQVSKLYSELEGRASQLEQQQMLTRIAEARVSTIAAEAGKLDASSLAYSPTALNLSTSQNMEVHQQVATFAERLSA